MEVEYTYIPGYDDSKRSRKSYSGTDIPFQATVKQEELNYLVSRDSLAARAWEMEISGQFNRGYEIKAWKKVGDVKEDNPQLKQNLENYYKSIDADAEVRQSVSLRWHYGFCPISVIRDEKDITKEQLKDEADLTKKILRISGIPGDQVKEIHLGKDWGTKDYGRIVGYTIALMADKGADEDTYIHGSRFIHIKNHWIDNHPAGIPKLHPLFDDFCVKKTLDAAMMEVPRQFARPLPIAYPTGTGEDKPSKEEYDGMKKAWVDITNRSYMVLPPNWKAELLSTSGALDPEPYWNARIEAIAAGTLGSKLALVGAEGGSISTAKENTNQFYTGLADKQNNEVSPIFYELARLGTLTGQISMGDNEGFEIVWNPLRQMDAQEEAEIAVLEARATLLRAQAFKAYWETGARPELDDDGDLTMTFEGVPLTTGMTGVPLVTARPLRAGVNAEAFGLDIAERQELYNEWVPRTTGVEAKTLNDVQTHMTTLHLQFLDLLNEQWANEIGDDDALKTGTTGIGPYTEKLIELRGETSPIKAAVNSTGAFQTTLTDWQPDLSDLEGTINEAGVEAWEISATEVGILHNHPLAPGQFLDEPTIAQIQADGHRMATDMWGTQSKAVMTEIENGLKANLGRAEIVDNVNKKILANTNNLNASVNRFVHTQASKARFNTMRSLGATSFVYLTSNDDRVRPTHAQLEGQIGDETTFMVPLSEFGCRCTIVPQTVWDDVVAKKTGAI